MKTILLLATLAIGIMAAGPASAATLNPDSGPIGIAVTITGEGFGKFTSVKANAVLFGKAPGLVEQWENTRIVVRVPRKAATGPVMLKSGKKTQSVGTFTVELPTVKEVSPKEAPPGQIVQIVGRNFGPTVGQKDSEMQFGVNEVLFNGVPAEVVRWRDTRIEVKVPSNATSGPLLVRLASVDPMPDGSCCAPVEYSVAQPVAFTVVSPIMLEPTEGPLGTPVVISGIGFGQRKPGADAVLFNGVPAPILEWTNTQIRVMFPLKGSSGPVTLKRAEQSKVVGEFRLKPHKVIGFNPDTAPVGSLVTISGENFGVFFEGGPNQVLIGGVPARIFQWSDRVIDVWVPVSAKSGPLVVRRGTGTAKPDGSCCEERGFATAEAGNFTLAVPTVTSVTPTTAEIGSLITIKGSGFGEFLKTDERTQDNVSREGHQHKFIQFGVNIARTAVLFPANKDYVKASHVAGYVESWTDTEIKVHVPQVAVPGTIMISRGSWDMLPDGTCCKDKEWVQSQAGEFTPTGLDKVTADYLEQFPGLGTMP
ncbi:MAG TPA: IPT/TIG domain-containing protein [Nitrospirales bacterium]|nr:IPT/TIG domain-containing protein [Nitrospirales bacterium]